MYKIGEIVKFPDKDDCNTVVQIYKHFDTVSGHCSNCCVHLDNLVDLGYEIISSMDNTHLLLYRKLKTKDLGLLCRANI